MSSRPHIFVASHHKVGTVWMMTTFIRIAKANAWEFIHLNEGESGWNLRPDKQDYFEARRAMHQSARPDEPAIFYNYHSDIPDLAACKQSPGVRGIHIIRDPRDMLLSAVRFHLKSNELWLDEPNPAWGGQTFRAKLASYTTLKDQIKFEMDTHMGWTIDQMAGLDDQGVFINVKYEDLITDHDMRRFHAVLVHLGLRGQELIRGLGAYWTSSIFGDRPASDLESTRSHIFNSAPQQWRTDLPVDILTEIESRFATQIRALGYPLSTDPRPAETA